MPTMILVIALALVRPALPIVLHYSASRMEGEGKASIESKVACSDNTTLLPAKRTPQACAETDFALYGRPVMFSPRDGIAYGVALAPDKPDFITIWMDNQTERPQNVYICCNATFVRYIDIYDQGGHRILSKTEIANSKPEAAAFHSGDPRQVAGCGCSGWSDVQPHSLKVVDHGDLNSNYTVAPGRYTIVEYPPRVGNAPAPTPSPTLPTLGTRLAITLP
jgi:hypothetical protein